MGRARPGALTVALVGLMIAACADTSGDAPEPEPPPYSAEARQLLEGLAAGDVLAGWTVEWVRGPQDSEISVSVRRGDVRFEAWFVRTGTTENPPPLSTGEYDLFFGRPVPAETSLSVEEAHQVLGLLAERITRNEATVVPEGM